MFTDNAKFRWFGEEEESVEVEKPLEDKSVFDFIIEEMSEEQSNISFKKIKGWLSNTVTLKNTLRDTLEILASFACSYIFLVVVLLMF